MPLTRSLGLPVLLAGPIKSRKLPGHLRLNTPLWALCGQPDSEVGLESRPSWVTESTQAAAAASDRGVMRPGHIRSRNRAHSESAGKRRQPRRRYY